MKKILSAVLALMIVTALGTTAMAATLPTAAGFYNIGTAENVTITPLAAGAAAESVLAYINNDSTPDTFYVNSDSLTVTYTAAVAGSYYGVILVEGTELPTKDNALFYIDQVTAASNSISFDVCPILPEETGDLSLYITTNAEGASMIKIPVSYAISGTYEGYLTGDVDNSGVVDAVDSLKVLQIAAEIIEATNVEQTVADVNNSGVIDSVDSLRILQYAAKIIDAWN